MTRASRISLYKPLAVAVLAMVAIAVGLTVAVKRNSARVKADE